MGRPAKNSEELIGVFDYEKNVFGGNTDERTIVGVLEDGIQVKGRAAAGKLEYGLTYCFSGYWHNHPAYGRQFVFANFRISTPNGERGTVSYLSKAGGIGKKRAQHIWNEFGSESLKIVREDPERIASAIKGMTLELAKAASAYFEANIAFEQTVIGLTDLLANRGFPKTIIEKIIEKYGAKSIEMIKAMPYILLRFRGVGFPTADKLYLDLGLDPSAIIRQSMCLWYAMQSDTQGHTWFPIDFCRAALEKSIGSCNVNPVEAMKFAIERGMCVTCEVNGLTYAAVRVKAMQEDTILYRIKNALDASIAESGEDWDSSEWSCNTRWPHYEGLDVSEHQAEQYRAATHNGRSRWAILAGRPGCGKTHAAAEVIRAYGEKYGFSSILVCAPTGMAAKRITQFMSGKGLPSRGMTIHRALGVGMVSDDGEFGFCHDADNPLPHRLIVVDECSMISCQLLSSLMVAIPSNAIVLFIGDPNQLAPIGHGAPLRDMIASGIPHGTLTEIRRNSGRIVQACSEILDTGTFTCGKKFDLDSGENLVCISNGNPDHQKATLQQTINGVRTFKGGYDPIWDVQVMTLVNDATPVCRKELNRVLQNYLNPSGKTVAGSPFREGDKIVCTKNGKVPACERNEWGIPSEEWNAFINDEVDEEGRVAAVNGEFGLVLRVEPNLTFVKLFDPMRIIKIPRGKGKDEEDTGCNWEIGYSVTFHKGQGNQWPFAVLIMDESGAAKFVGSRELVYTGLSRGQVGTLIIGNLSTARLFCRKTGIWNRRTLLKEKLMGEIGAASYVEVDSSEAISL